MERQLSQFPSTEQDGDLCIDGCNVADLGALEAAQSLFNRAPVPDIKQSRMLRAPLLRANRTTSKLKLIK